MRDIRTPAYRIDPRIAPSTPTALAQHLLADLTRHVRRPQPFYASATQTPPPPAPVPTAADLAAPVSAAIRGQQAAQAGAKLSQASDQIKQLGLRQPAASSIPRQDYSGQPGTFKAPARDLPSTPAPTGPQGLEPGLSPAQVDQLRALHKSPVYDPNNTAPKPPTAREIMLAKQHAASSNCAACHGFLVGAQRAARGQAQIERLRQEQRARLAAQAKRQARQPAQAPRAAQAPSRTVGSATFGMLLPDTLRQQGYPNLADRMRRAKGYPI